MDERQRDMAAEFRPNGGDSFRDHFDQQIGRMREHFDTRVTDTQKMTLHATRRMEGLEAQMEDLSQRLDDLSRRFSDLGRRFGDLEQRHDSLKPRRRYW